MTKNRLIIANVILIVLLIIITIKEQYIKRIIFKLQPKEITEETFMESRDYMRETDLYKFYNKKGNVVMLGNSLTYNVDWNELLNRNDIINRGIGLDITKGFLSRMEQVYNVQPKLCFIMGGINDIKDGISSDSIIKNIKEITLKLNTKNIKAIVISVLPVSKKFSDYRKVNNKVDIINKRLNNLCKATNIDFIDLNKSFSNNELYYSQDGIHLTGLGYSKWRDAILPVIKRELDE